MAKNMDFMEQFQRPTGKKGKLVAALMNTSHKALTTWGLTHVEIAPDYVILDVGCGGGKTINRLAKQAPQGKVYGIDHSPDMVKYAKKVNEKFINQNRVEIVEGKVEKTNFPDKFFDLVTACETYYFWSSLPNAFKEIERILKPNGKLLMVNEMIKDGIFEQEKADLIQKTHVKLFTLDQISDWIKTAGFSKVEVYKKENSPWNTFLAQKTPV
ncbi:MAG: class I SAM-dependent methyltransferase [Crenarchaeota archaeon]|nr:class I SAM-dependent methyltransferase [Thermoproteota archaeon]